MEWKQCFTKNAVDLSWPVDYSNMPHQTWWILFQGPCLAQATILVQRLGDPMGYVQARGRGRPANHGAERGMWVFG